MLQQALVAVVVLAAAAFTFWKLIPARWRLRSLLGIDAWAAKHPQLGGWRERALKPRIARAGGIGCDGCAANTPRPPRSPR